jgi:hypothetical protein
LDKVGENERMTSLGNRLLGKLWFAATMSVVLLTIGLTSLVAGLGAVFFGNFVEVNAFFIFYIVLALVGAVFATLGGLYLRLWIQIVHIRTGRQHRNS